MNGRGKGMHRNKSERENYPVSLDSYSLLKSVKAKSIKMVSPLKSHIYKCFYITCLNTLDFHPKVDISKGVT